MFNRQNISRKRLLEWITNKSDRTSEEIYESLITLAANMKPVRTEGPEEY